MPQTDIRGKVIVDEGCTEDRISLLLLCRLQYCNSRCWIIAKGAPLLGCALYLSNTDCPFSETFAQ